MGKYQVRQFITLVLSGLMMALALIGTTYAQCVSKETLQRNAAQSYLIRIKHIGQQPVDGSAYAGARYDTRAARFEVLKVYKGDPKAISQLGSASLVVHCGVTGGPHCRILQEGYYPFYETQLMVVYDAPDADDVVTLKVGVCLGTQRLMADANEVALFEARYQPIWVSQTWCKEKPQDEDCSADYNNKAIKNEQNETSAVQPSNIEVQNN